MQLPLAEVISGGDPTWITDTLTEALAPPSVGVRVTVVENVPSPVPGSSAASVKRLIATSAPVAILALAEFAESHGAPEVTANPSVPHNVWLSA